MKYAALIVKTGNGYSADPPGCIAAADTFEETRNLIRAAANYHVAIMADDASGPANVDCTLASV